MKTTQHASSSDGTQRHSKSVTPDKTHCVQSIPSVNQIRGCLVACYLDFFWGAPWQAKSKQESCDKSIPMSSCWGLRQTLNSKTDQRSTQRETHTKIQRSTISQQTFTKHKTSKQTLPREQNRTFTFSQVTKHTAEKTNGMFFHGEGAAC